MRIMSELLPGALLLWPPRFDDARGSFVKTFHEGTLSELGIKMAIREEFYSRSNANVIRGMHFQLPPHDHDKLVYCLQGSALDVLLDIRAGKGYGRYAVTELSAANRLILFIPRGIAHGFRALTNNTILLYKTSTVHAPAADCGIRWDSFGLDWGTTNPVVSERDQQHLPLADFRTPF